MGARLINENPHLSGEEGAYLLLLPAALGAGPVFSSRCQRVFPCPMAEPVP